MKETVQGEIDARISKKGFAKASDLNNYVKKSTFNNHRHKVGYHTAPFKYKDKAIGSAVTHLNNYGGGASVLTTMPT